MIQALRAIAAGVVFIGHLLLTGGTKPEWMVPVIERVTSPFTHAGVDLFFAISGAIMYLVTRNSPGGLEAARVFMTKRALRIYPLFWAALIVMLLIRGAEFTSTADAFGQLSLYAPSPILSVGWTLTMEIRFYLIVGLALVFLPGNGDRRFLGVGTVICLLVALGYFRLIPADMGTRTTMLEFVGGAAVAAIAVRTTRFAITSMVFGAVLMAVVLIWWWPTGTWLELSPYRVLMFGVPSLFILYGAMALEGDQRATAPNWLVRAGDVSYSTYIWHLPIIAAVSAWWPREVIPFNLWAYLAIVIALTAAVSAVSWRVIEMPSQRLATLNLAHFHKERVRQGG